MADNTLAELFAMNVCNMEFIYIIGIDFIDAFGVRVTSTQAIRKGTGTAYALINFENGKIVEESYLSVVDKEDFISESFKLLDNSIPQNFKKVS